MIMKRKFVILTLLAISVLTSNAVLAESKQPIVREEVKVVIDGIEELWRLEWLGTTSPVCGPEDEDWLTCPCTGFAFGERGDLRLVRKRPGKKDERFSLNSLFEYGDDWPSGSAAVLRRWDVYNDDYNKSNSPTFVSRIKARPLSKIMNFLDYDHDGRATEFILQIGTLPCGKRTSIVVGISRKNPRLHAFTSTGNSEVPLMLQAWQWDSLSRAKGHVKVIDWQCGDHASEVEEELELRAENGNIYVTRRKYQCMESGARRQLIEEKISTTK